MCKCGCNTCETKIKGPLLTEGKVKSLLSEGLQYHIDKKIPLFETVYRIGSDKHLALIKEARKMYSRNVIDLCEDDEALIGTHLGEFGLYEGVSVPLDLPMLEESYDYDEVAQSEFGMDYDQLGSGEKEWVRDEIDNMEMRESSNESKMPTQDQVDKFFALTQNEIHYLNSKPVAGQEKTFNKMEVEPWDEYDLSNWNSLVRKAKSKGKINEDDRKHALLRVEPRNYEAMIDKLQDMNINHRRESDNVIKVYIDNIPDKVIYNLTHDVYVDKFVLKESLKENEDKLLKIKQELEALRPGTISWIDDIFISSYDGSLQVELDYTLYPDEIKQLAQIATKYGMELKYMTGKNATLVKNKINEDRKYNQEELLRLDLIAHRKFDCDYKKCTDEQKAEVLKDKVKVGVREALQEATIAKKVQGSKKGKQFVSVNENFDKAVGGFPYKMVGSKAVISEPMDDETKERMIKRAKSLGYSAAPNMAGGITIMPKLNESMVDYDFSKEELIRVIKQLKRGASTEIGMIKAFEKALGRELTDDEIRGFKLNEDKKKKKKEKKDPPLNKPKRGGSKAYYVYVRDPKTKKIKKVSFGSGGLRAKIKNAKARKAFAARHNCKNKKDRTKAGYWSCNLPRYAEALGLGAKMNTFW